MRQINLRAGTALALILPVLMAPAFMTNAAAQEKKDPRAGGAPAARAAPPAPVQHAAPPAPAPHIAAPVAATPHFAAPAARIARARAAAAAGAHPAAAALPAAAAHSRTGAHCRTHPHGRARSCPTPHVATQQIIRPNFTRSNGAHDNAANAVVKQQQIQAHGNNVGPNNLGNNAGAHDLAHRGLNNPNAEQRRPDHHRPEQDRYRAEQPEHGGLEARRAPTRRRPSTATPNVLGQGPGIGAREIAVATR